MYASGNCGPLAARSSHLFLPFGKVLTWVTLWCISLSFPCNNHVGAWVNHTWTSPAARRGQNVITGRLRHASPRLFNSFSSQNFSSIIDRILNMFCFTKNNYVKIAKNNILNVYECIAENWETSASNPSWSNGAARRPVATKCKPVPMVFVRFLFRNTLYKLKAFVMSSYSRSRNSSTGIITKFSYTRKLEEC